MYSISAAARSVPGAYDFKTYWGFEPAPLVYQFRLAAGHELPDLNPLNPKFRALIALWKRLPLAVADPPWPDDRQGHRLTRDSRRRSAKVGRRRSCRQRWTRFLPGPATTPSFVP